MWEEWLLLGRQDYWQNSIRIMRKRILCVLSLLVIILCSISCRDSYYIETDLHGMWQVAEVENYSTGEVVKNSGELYYMFQRTLVCLYYKRQSAGKDEARYIAHFDLMKSDSIGMGGFRYYTTGEGDNVNKETLIPLNRLHKFGIFQDYTVFHMQRLEHKLVLTSDSARIVLREY